MFKFTPTEAVTIDWFGHPGDTPNDVRARRFIVKWREGSILSTQERKRMAEMGKVVLRWEYKCRGICSLPPSGVSREGREEDDTEDVYEDSELHSTPAAYFNADSIVKGGSEGKGMKSKKKRSRWQKCNSGVSIVMSVSFPFSSGLLYNYLAFKD